MLRGHDDLALHETAGGELRVGQRLLDRGPFAFRKDVQDRCLLRRVEVLDQVDHVIGIELADRLGQHLRREDADDFLAQRLVEFREDVAVHLVPVKPDQPHPVVGVHLFQKVGDVGRVQRLHELDKLLPVVGVYGVQNPRDGLAVEVVSLVARLFPRVLVGHCLAFLRHVPALPRFLSRRLGQAPGKQQGRLSFSQRPHRVCADCAGRRSR